MNLSPAIGWCSLLGLMSDCLLTLPTNSQGHESPWLQLCWFAVLPFQNHHTRRSHDASTRLWYYVTGESRKCRAVFMTMSSSSTSPVVPVEVWTTRPCTVHPLPQYAAIILKSTETLLWNFCTCSELLWMSQGAHNIFTVFRRNSPILCFYWLQHHFFPSVSCKPKSEWILLDLNQALLQARYLNTAEVISYFLHDLIYRFLSWVNQ